MAAGFDGCSLFRGPGPPKQTAPVRLFPLKRTRVDAGRSVSSAGVIRSSNFGIYAILLLRKVFDGREEIVGFTNVVVERDDNNPVWFKFRKL